MGTGRAEWDHVHVRDVSALIVALVDAALDIRPGAGAGARRGDPEEIFGARAYYFCESGAHVWGEVAAQIGAEAVRQGLLKEVMVRLLRGFTLSHVSFVNGAAGFPHLHALVSHGARPRQVVCKVITSGLRLTDLLC